MNLFARAGIKDRASFSPLCLVVVWRSDAPAELAFALAVSGRNTAPGSALLGWAIPNRTSRTDAVFSSTKRRIKIRVTWQLPRIVRPVKEKTLPLNWVFEHLDSSTGAMCRHDGVATRHLRNGYQVRHRGLAKRYGHMTFGERKMGRNQRGYVPVISHQAESMRRFCQGKMQFSCLSGSKVVAQTPRRGQLARVGLP